MSAQANVPQSWSPSFGSSDNVPVSEAASSVASTLTTEILTGASASTSTIACTSSFIAACSPSSAASSKTRVPAGTVTSVDTLDASQRRDRLADVDVIGARPTEPLARDGHVRVGRALMSTTIGNLRRSVPALT